MASPIKHTRSDDHWLLHVLDLFDGEGMSDLQIAKHLNTTKGVVVGKRKQVRDATQPCECVKPENMDGGMPRRWWASEQGGAA